MTVGVAGLPMYDWPEVTGAINALWLAIANRIQLAGVETPASVWRPTGHQTLTDLWTHPDLLLAQACGLPVVQALARKVTVLGSLDYAVPGCDPGDYRSVLVCRTDDPSLDLAAFRGRRVAFNESDSQSGMGH